MKGLVKRVGTSALALVMLTGVGMGVTSTAYAASSGSTASVSVNVPTIKARQVSSMEFYVGTTFSVDAAYWVYATTGFLPEYGNLGKYQVVSAKSSKYSGLQVKWLCTEKVGKTVLGCSNQVKAIKAGKYTIKVRIMDKSNKNKQTDYTIKVTVMNKPKTAQVIKKTYTVSTADKTNMSQHYSYSALLQRGASANCFFPAVYGDYKRVISVSNKSVADVKIVSMNVNSAGYKEPALKVTVKKTGKTVVKVETTSGRIIQMTLNCKK